MPGHSPLVDPATFMPWGPIEKILQWAAKAERFAPSYEEAHEVLLFQGFTFAETLDLDFGSDGSLAFLGELLFTGSWEDWNVWPSRFDWIIASPVEEVSPASSRMRVGVMGWPFPLIGPLQSKWENMVANSIWMAYPGHPYYLGIMQRQVVHWVQHRIAKTVQNAFGLDNRGAPSSL